MVAHLYKDFLENEASYEETVTYWRKLVDEVAEERGYLGEWREWQTKYYADGTTPIPRDLRAIFDARCDRLHRSVQILQGLPTRNEVEIAAWLQKNGTSEDDQLDELVINLALSVESAAIAKDLLKYWMNPRITVDAMGTIVQEWAPGSD